MKKEAEEVYRRAAVRVVDAIHDFEPHLVVVTGRSWNPAYSLIAEAHKRRYGTSLPKRKHLESLKAEDIAGKKVVIFDDVVVTGGTLHVAKRLISKHGPVKVKLLGLIKRYRNKLPRSQIPEEDLLIHWRSMELHDRLSKLRAAKSGPEKVRYKKDMREWTKMIADKRAELRRIASTIEPRKNTGQ